MSVQATYAAIEAALNREMGEILTCGNAQSCYVKKLTAIALALIAIAVGCRFRNRRNQFRLLLVSQEELRIRSALIRKRSLIQLEPGHYDRSLVRCSLLQPWKHLPQRFRLASL